MSVVNPLAVPRRGLGPARPVTVRSRWECGEPVPRTGDLVRTERAERPIPQRSGGHGPRRDRRTHEVPRDCRRCRQAGTLRPPGRICAAGRWRMCVAARSGSGAIAAKNIRRREASSPWRHSVPEINKPQAYRGGTEPEVGGPACPDCRPTVPGRPAASLHKAAGCPHRTAAESEGYQPCFDVGARDCTFRPHILPYLTRRDERRRWISGAERWPDRTGPAPSKREETAVAAETRRLMKFPQRSGKCAATRRTWRPEAPEGSRPPAAASPGKFNGKTVDNLLSDGANLT